MSLDPVGDYIASLARELRARGIDPTTYRADRTGARRSAVDRQLERACRRAVRARLTGPVTRRGPIRRTVAVQRVTGA